MRRGDLLQEVSAVALCVWVNDLHPATVILTSTCLGPGSAMGRSTRTIGEPILVTTKAFCDMLELMDVWSREGYVLERPL